MTSPPPAAPHGRTPEQGAPVGPGVTRIVQTNELPPGVDVLAAADGTTIIVRASLDRAARRQAVREVMSVSRAAARGLPGAAAGGHQAAGCPG